VGGDIIASRIIGTAILLDTCMSVATQGQRSVIILVRKTGPLFANCEIIIGLMPDYQDDVTSLCIITVIQIRCYSDYTVNQSH
jgi:hypothetical protein